MRRGQQAQPVLKVRLVPLAHRERRDLKALLVLPALQAPLVRWDPRVLKDQPGRPGHKALLAHKVIQGLQVQVSFGEAHGIVPQAMRLPMSWSLVAQVMWR